MPSTDSKPEDHPTVFNFHQPAVVKSHDHQTLVSIARSSAFDFGVYVVVNVMQNAR